MYYNTRNSIPVAVLSPTITTQHVEQEEPRYVATDVVTAEEDDHDYVEVNPPIHDFYAVPNRSRNIRSDSDNDVTLVDNDVYTENHGEITPPTDGNDVTIVDNVIYTENHGDVPHTEGVKPAFTDDVH